MDLQKEPTRRIAMRIKKLDHITIRTALLEETIAFYSQVLGMTVGPFPGGDLGRGAWIYDEGGQPAVHLGLLREEEAQTRGSGAIDHVAFEGVGHDELAARLTRLGMDFKRNEVASINLRQLFVRDPNGILVELNFR
jgi:catechol 2,3-dioxygenase-like lactoylglutathione lyase family enzyme